MILSYFQIENDFLKKYESIAENMFDPDFFSKEKALALLQEGNLSKKISDYIISYLDASDEYIQKFMWLYYYFLFKGEEDFTLDIWELDKIPVPNNWEEKYPGALKATVYLFAYEIIKDWVASRNLSSDISMGYFKRYAYFSELNEITHKTVGLCRLSPFLYTYAKAGMLLIKRLSFQLVRFDTCLEMYENRAGKRLFVATDKYSYGSDGLQAKTDFYPVHKQKGNFLFAHTFKDDGTLNMVPEEIDLSEYSLCLSHKDTVVTVHIPEGGKLTPELVKESLLEAKSIFEKYHPSARCFRCRTWFIDPSIRNLLPKGGNLEAFANIFDTVSGADNEYHSVFEHIFKTEKCDFSALVPKNKFQQDILDYITDGNRLFWGIGVLKKDYF